MSFWILICKITAVLLRPQRVTEASWNVTSGELNMNLLHKHQGPLLLTWINFNPSMDK